MVINLNIVTAKAREWRDRATPYALWGYGKGAGSGEWGIGCSPAIAGYTEWLR